MADAADITQARTEHEERFVRQQIAAAATAGSGLRPKGLCHNCSEPVQSAQLFCDDLCEADHSARERERRQRLGRRA